MGERKLLREMGTFWACVLDGGTVKYYSKYHKGPKKKTENKKRKEAKQKEQEERGAWGDKSASLTSLT